MNHKQRLLRSLTFAVLFTFAFVLPATAQKNVRVKIGMEIQSGDITVRAKTKDRLKAGDKLRLYVIPAVDSYVYVVYTDKHTVTLLHPGQGQARVKKDSTLVLPSSAETYQIDGASKKEWFTIICSPKALKEVSTLFASADLSYSSWAELEGALIEKSQIELSEEVEKPIALAGNVREPKTEVPFLDSLPLLSGKGLVVKRYEFRVQK